jgi:hypothetical protein
VSDRYLTSQQVRHRYGDVSDMSLWRWLHDGKIGFPRPIIINRRRYWHLRDLEAWERVRCECRARIT